MNRKNNFSMVDTAEIRATLSSAPRWPAPASMRVWLPKWGRYGVIASLLVACASDPTKGSSVPSPKQQAAELLKSLETGDEKPLAYINPAKYVQHNLRVADGIEAFRKLKQERSAAGLRVNTIRVFQDGEHVFLHSEYFLLGKRRIGFDIFRFEAGKIVEHWDNLQDAAANPSPSGHTMTDGPAVAIELEKTPANKSLMQAYMDDLLQGRREKFASYYNGTRYIQHSPLVADDLPGLFAGLQALAKQGLAVKYEKVHKILGEGNFVLVVAEGRFGTQPSSYYDLYRIEDGKIAEHWDTIEPIPARAEWNNSNGKF